MKTERITDHRLRQKVCCVHMLVRWGLVLVDGESCADSRITSLLEKSRIRLGHAVHCTSDMGSTLPMNCSSLPFQQITRQMAIHFTSGKEVVSAMLSLKPRVMVSPKNTEILAKDWNLRDRYLWGNSWNQRMRRSHNFPEEWQKMVLSRMFHVRLLASAKGTTSQFSSLIGKNLSSQ